MTRALTAILRDIDTITKAKILPTYKENALRALHDEIEAGYGQQQLDLGAPPPDPKATPGGSRKGP